MSFKILRQVKCLYIFVIFSDMTRSSHRFLTNKKKTLLSGTKRHCMRTFDRTAWRLRQESKVFTTRNAAVLTLGSSLPLSLYFSLSDSECFRFTHESTLEMLFSSGRCHVQAAAACWTSPEFIPVSVFFYFCFVHFWTVACVHAVPGWPHAEPRETAQFFRSKVVHCTNSYSEATLHQCCQKCGRISVPTRPWNLSCPSVT